MAGVNGCRLYLVTPPAIDLDAEGQAFSWAQDGSRTLFAVDRRMGRVRMIDIPIVVPADAEVSLGFR